MSKKPVNNALEIAFKKAVEDKTANKKNDIKSVLFDKSKSEVKRIEIQSKGKKKNERVESKATV